jgi:hypothetical protein
MLIKVIRNGIMRYFSIFFFYFVKYTLLKDISNGRLIFSETYKSPMQPRLYKFIYFSQESHSWKQIGLIQTEINFARRMFI